MLLTTDKDCGLHKLMKIYKYNIKEKIGKAFLLVENNKSAVARDSRPELFIHAWIKPVMSHDNLHRLISVTPLLRNKVS